VSVLLILAGNTQQDRGRENAPESQTLKRGQSVVKLVENTRAVGGHELKLVAVHVQSLKNLTLKTTESVLVSTQLPVLHPPRNNVVT
jgi:hypothetical protein